MSKLLEDVRNINKELSEFINSPSWNRPTFYNDDDDEYTVIYRKPKEITLDLPTEEPNNSPSMGDEHLNTIPETEKTSIDNLFLIPSEFKVEIILQAGIILLFSLSIDDKIRVICPFVKILSTFDALNDHSEILSDSNDDGTSSDDNDFEDIEYVSLEEVNDVDQEENEFDLEDILQIQDVILREKLLNIIRLITNIESLNDNPTPDRVLKSPSLVLISVTDSNSFFEKSDTSFSFSDNSLLNSRLLVIIRGGEIDFSQNVEDDDSFTFVIRTFLPYLTYPVDSPLFLYTGSEDAIFDPGIST
ncbi:hypothetical protein Tco_1179752 [Tanacetum coccineum]